MTEIERVLAFERRRWNHEGAKAQAIHDEFGVTPTRYYQVLQMVINDPVALQVDPQTVNRLRRLRQTRRASRCGLDVTAR